MGTASKAELARCSGLTNAAVGDIVSSLENQGLIYYGEKRHVSGRGQPATTIHLNGTGAFSIGERLDRTAIETVLIDFDGNLSSRTFYDMLLPEPQRALEIVKKDIDSMLDFLKKNRQKRLSGIGLAIPFNLESRLTELNLPSDLFLGWKDYDFTAESDHSALMQVPWVRPTCRFFIVFLQAKIF